MTKSYQDEQDFIYNGKQNCKFAYALGQDGFSALCNIIDQSPLFYIEADYDDEILEDELLELEELRAELMGGEAAEMVKEKHQKLAGASKHLTGYEKADLEDALNANKESVFAKTVNPVAAADYIETLQQSNLAKQLIEFAKNYGVSFKISSQIFNVFYDRDGAQILINPTANKSAAILGLAKALRQVWKHKNGVLIHPLSFQPDDAILLNRLHVADEHTAQCRIAWELKLAGDEQAWKDLMGSVCYDLGSAFAKEAIADFRSLNNGQAAAACFENWFLSGRCKATDKKLIQTMLADHNGMVFEHPETSRAASYEIIATLGEMPSGKNYLSGLVHQIAEDPLYAEVRDRSNANFLWFIKFERSFRDSEQSLQKESSPNSDVQSAFPLSEDQSNESKGHNIISFKPVLPAEKADRSDARKRGSDEQAEKKGEDFATVYYLEHFKKPSQKMRSSE